MIKVNGIANVNRNIMIKEFQANARAEAFVQRATQALRRRVRENISLIWESIEAQKFHPYSVEFGTITVGSPNWYLVHKVTEDMRNALSSDVVNEGFRVVGSVGYTTDAENSLHAPKSMWSYLRCVIFGTRKMISRDFLGESLKGSKDQNQTRAIRYFKDLVK